MSRYRASGFFVALGFAIAALARGWGLWQRGLLEHDEGHAILNANTWNLAMKWVFSQATGGAASSMSLSELGESIHQQGGTLYSAGKLGYSILVAVAGLPDQVTTGLALALAWLAGLLVAVLAAAMAWQYTRRLTAAIIAAGGCLSSPLLTDLSREASGTIWAVVFALTALWIIQRSTMPAGGPAETPFSTRKRILYGIAGGLLLAYGFICHFNLAPFIIAVYATSMVHAAGGTGPLIPRLKQGFIAVIPAMAGGILGLLIIETITRAVDLLLRNAYPEFLPLSGELHLLFFRDQAPMLDGVLYGDGAIGWGPEAWAVYGNALLREGSVWLFLVLLAVPVLCFRISRRSVPGGPQATPALYRQWRIGPPITLLLIPTLFYIAYVYRVERSLGMCMAASWILIGTTTGPWLETLFTNIRGRRLRIVKAAMVILIGGQFAWAGYQWAEICSARSPLPLVVKETFASPLATGLQVTAGSFDVGFAPIWKWAIVEHQRKTKAAAAPPDTSPHVDFSRFEGAQLIFIDPSTWFRPNQEFTATAEQVEAAQLILKATSKNPPWVLKAYRLIP